MQRAASAKLAAANEPDTHLKSLAENLSEPGTRPAALAVNRTAAHTAALRRRRLKLSGAERRDGQQLSLDATTGSARGACLTQRRAQALLTLRTCGKLRSLFWQAPDAVGGAPSMEAHTAY